MIARPHFRKHFIYAAVAVALSGKNEDALFQEELAYEAEKYHHMSVEKLLEQLKGQEDFFRDNAFFNLAERLLRERCETMMEE